MNNITINAQFLRKDNITSKKTGQIFDMFCFLVEGAKVLRVFPPKFRSDDQSSSEEKKQEFDKFISSLQSLENVNLSFKPYIDKFGSLSLILTDISRI